MTRNMQKNKLKKWKERRRKDNKNDKKYVEKEIKKWEEDEERTIKITKTKIEEERKENNGQKWRRKDKKNYRKK